MPVGETGRAFGMLDSNCLSKNDSSACIIFQPVIHWKRLQLFEKGLWIDLPCLLRAGGAQTWVVYHCFQLQPCAVQRVDFFKPFILYWGSKITVDSDWIHEIRIHLLLERKAMTNLDSIFKVKTSFYRQRSIAVEPSQSYGFSNSYVQMWELDHKEGWVLKNWCFWTMLLEKTLRVPWTTRK